MNETRLDVIVIVLGMLGLAFGGFGYFQEANAATSEHFGAAIDDMGTITVSVCLGMAALIAGFLLLITRREE